jgi:hypothetical protein
MENIVHFDGSLLAPEFATSMALFKGVLRMEQQQMFTFSTIAFRFSMVQS